MAGRNLNLPKPLRRDRRILNTEQRDGEAQRKDCIIQVACGANKEAPTPAVQRQRSMFREILLYSFYSSSEEERPDCDSSLPLDC